MFLYASLFELVHNLKSQVMNEILIHLYDCLLSTISITLPHESARNDDEKTRAPPFKWSAVQLVCMSCLSSHLSPLTRFKPKMKQTIEEI